MTSKESYTKHQNELMASKSEAIKDAELALKNAELHANEIYKKLQSAKESGKKITRLESSYKRSLDIVATKLRVVEKLYKSLNKISKVPDTYTKRYDNDFLYFSDSKLGEYTHHSTYYYKKPFILHIDFESFDDHGELKKWTFIGDNIFDEGNSVNSFINYLNSLIKKFDLDHDKNRDDTLILYTDNLNCVKGFFGQIITHSMDICTTLMHHFEVRDYTLFRDDISYTEAYDYMKELFDKIFLPENYIYFTPNQRTKKRLSRAARVEKCTLAKEIFPDYSDYLYLKNASFGGTMYIRMPNMDYIESIIHVDFVSAYIYSLLTQEHVCSKGIKENPDNFIDINKREHTLTVGTYEIEYDSCDSLITMYKEHSDLDGNRKRLDLGHHKVEITLTNIDLSSLLFILKDDLKSIKCNYLISYKSAILPKYIRDILVEEFIKKSHIDKYSEENLYKLQKVILNGIFGQSFRNFKTIKEYKHFKENASTTTEWGLFTMSYTRKFLLQVATQVDSWLYSDTDSIFCFDTEKSRSIINNFNQKIISKNKVFCEQYGYNFDDLKLLGTFDYEKNVTRFKAYAKKKYLYTEEDGTVVVKSAGSDKSQFNSCDESIYDKKDLPIGKRTFGYIKNNSYYEYTSTNDQEIQYLTIIDEMKKTYL